MGIQRTAVAHLTRNDSSQSYGVIHPSPALGAEESSEESDEDDDDSDEDDSDEDDSDEDDDDDDDDDNDDDDDDEIEEEANSGEYNDKDVTTAHDSDNTIELIYQGMG